jgi:hypothetical protein
MAAVPAISSRNCESRAAGDLDVEEEQVGTHGVDSRLGPPGIAVLADELDVVFKIEELADSRPPQRLIVDDRGADPPLRLGSGASHLAVRVYTRPRHTLSAQAAPCLVKRDAPYIDSYGASSWRPGMTLRGPSGRPRDPSSPDR